jgi:hypothetical protein
VGYGIAPGVELLDAPLSAHVSAILRVNGSPEVQPEA